MWARHTCSAPSSRRTMPTGTGPGTAPSSCRGACTRLPGCCMAVATTRRSRRWRMRRRVTGHETPRTAAAAGRTPGAAVLRVPIAGQVIGHIVISDGQGGTVEAHSTNRGVIRDTLGGRRWDMGVLVPGIDYSRNPEPQKVTPPAVVYRLMSPKMKGPVVRLIQDALKAKGIDPGERDGIFGGQTFAAVRAFQLTNGL